MVVKEAFWFERSRIHPRGRVHVNAVQIGDYLISNTLKSSPLVPLQDRQTTESIPTRRSLHIATNFVEYDWRQIVHSFVGVKFLRIYDCRALGCTTVARNVCSQQVNYVNLRSPDIVA